MEEVGSFLCLSEILLCPFLAFFSGSVMKNMFVSPRGSILEILLRV